MTELLGFQPDWPAPPGVRSFISYRSGGLSQGPYASNNLGHHVGDDPDAVRENRERLRRHLGIDEPVWLNQVHGTRIVRAEAVGHLPEADGSTTQERGRVCAVLSADCLPVLLCDSAGTQVAAVHCGWRGLAEGILAQAIAEFASPASELLAYLGPAIGPRRYEVGAEVRDALARSVDYDAFSKPVADKPNHFLVDLYAVARAQLHSAGLTAIYGGGRCTFDEEEHFFSYRRDGVTGRMASLIWLD